MSFITQLYRFLFKSSVVNLARLFHKLKLRFLFLTQSAGKVSKSITFMMNIENTEATLIKDYFGRKQCKITMLAGNIGDDTIKLY